MLNGPAGSGAPRRRAGRGEGRPSSPEYRFAQRSVRRAAHVIHHMSYHTPYVVRICSSEKPSAKRGPPGRRGARPGAGQAAESKPDIAGPKGSLDGSNAQSAQTGRARPHLHACLVRARTGRGNKRVGGPPCRERASRSLSVLVDAGQCALRPVRHSSLICFSGACIAEGVSRE